MSTVAIRNAGSRRYSDSSTATTGSARSPEKSHAKLAQTRRRARGRSAFGWSENDSGLNRSPHHGQFSSGIGDGLRSGSPLN